MKRLDRSEIIFKIVAYVILTLFALACLYPFIFILSASISSKAAVDESRVYLWPVGFHPMLMQRYSRKADSGWLIATPCFIQCTVPSYRCL